MKGSGVLITMLAATYSSRAIADPADSYGHPHMFGDYGFGMIMGPVFMLLFLAAVVVAIVALVKWIAPSAGFSEDKTNNNAIHALNLRFASGEIDAKEYAERKKLLLG